MAEINLSRAKQLCNASELKVVRASGKQSLPKLSEAQLKKAIGQARKLRDKWRDLATRQRRETQRQQNARTTDENARSGEKEELFSQVLARFETQLAKIAGSATAPSGAPASKTPKKKRNQAHRLIRSVTRDEMETKRQSLNTQATVKKKTAKKKAAKKVAAKPSATKKQASSKPASGAAKPKKKVAKKKAKAASATSLPAMKDIATNPLQQLQAQAATKRTRLKSSGLVSRVRGHISARGRKNQAKRDSR